MHDKNCIFFLNTAFQFSIPKVMEFTIELDIALIFKIILKK